MAQTVCLTAPPSFPSAKVMSCPRQHDIATILVISIPLTIPTPGTTWNFRKY